jgi:hypothetical protein
LPFLTRLWFAWLAFFRVLFDGEFAQRVWTVREALPEAEKTTEPKTLTATVTETVKVTAAPAVTEEERNAAALQLLALLQRDGRFVDFLMQDVTSFSDADVGTAARVVHEGCRKAINGHMKIEPVREEEEETTVTVEAGFDAAAVKLSGKVEGSPPFKGKLRHKGWRAKDIKLPTTVKGHDATVLAPAEVEL